MKPHSTRIEAVNIIQRQLHGDGAILSKKTAYHYGKEELKQLLDALYGGPPACKEEELS